MKTSQSVINEHRKTNKGFLIYMPYSKKNIAEWCSNCEGEVEIKNIAEKQVCLECGTVSGLALFVTITTLIALNV